MFISLVVESCRALFGIEFLDNVAKGKQDEADIILKSFEDKQTLLRTPDKLTDYSGRTFHCTAYEYAYWAKDTHMQRMLEGHMDDETKVLMLEKINEMERSGLLYQQHGISYQNAHYDTSFVLKQLTVDEFRQLQTIMGESFSEIQQATTDNYKNISFTAREYERLKECLKWYCQRQTSVFSFFNSSPETMISEKLQFDFCSLITALKAYVKNCNTSRYNYKFDYKQQIEDWMNVGKAQRDVPAHVAHEYCRPDQSFGSDRSFNEENLPRVLTFYNYAGSPDKFWFPLSSSSSGLGFDFAVTRLKDQGKETWAWGWNGRGELTSSDLMAVRHLDRVRTADLVQSRENLSRATSHLKLVN